jgi:hypothetical protein
VVASFINRTNSYKYNDTGNETLTARSTFKGFPSGIGLQTVMGCVHVVMEWARKSATERMMTSSAAAAMKNPINAGFSHAF